MALKRRWKGLAAFPGILVYKAYLPRGFRCLGESGLTSLGLGTAETETASLGHFDCAHCCRCFCIYLVCFYDRVTPILTGSAFPCCPLVYSLPCRNQCQAHHKRTRPNTMSTTITPIARTPRLSFMLISFMVDLAGVEPASRTLFLPLHTAIACIYTCSGGLGFSCPRSYCQCVTSPVKNPR